VLALIVSTGQASAFAPTGKPSTPNLDKRTAAPPSAQFTPARQQAAAQLQARIPSARIDYDPVTGAPAWIASVWGFLSGPDSDQEMVPRTAQSPPAATDDDPHHSIKRFLNENAALFEHGAEVLTNNAAIAREFVTARNGMRTVVWEQQLDGIPVFEGALVGHITKRGELVNISSHFLPDIVTSSGLDSTSRLNVENAPPMSARQAVVNALTDVGETITVDGVTPVGPALVGPVKEQAFTAAPLSGQASVSLAWLPMSRTSVRLCWSVQFVRRSSLETLRAVVDASSGEVLVRLNQTCSYSNASYRVYTSDSPSPFSPGWSFPLTNQPAVVATQLLTLSALSAVASPNGWINDGDNQTAGNNVTASLNRSAQRPNLTLPTQGSSWRVFDFPLDLSQDPSNYENFAVVNLFYRCNWMHDRLYDLGFTEAAGNFQNNNFGRGGASGPDGILAYAQYGADVHYEGGYANNSYFFPAGDGTNGEIWMFLFTGPAPARDSDLDSERVCHEYTHGLSNRLVGQGNSGIGITAPQSLGLGEGWSDFYALSLLSEPGDNVHGSYPMGGYATYDFGHIFNQNYYYGIRRYPYSTDVARNPLTLRDIDPNLANNCSSGVPYTTIGIRSLNPCTSTNASEAHNVGEVWCVTLWEARANVIDHYGWLVGNELILELVTDGMVLSPADPTFTQARDAIIQADLVDTGGANWKRLWTAFARRGLGWGAVAPPSSTTTGVTESYFLPAEGNQLWSYATAGAIYSSPGVGPDGTVYIGSSDGHLYAINPNGALKWAFTQPASYVSFNCAPVVAGDGTIYSRRSDGYLYAVNPNGTLKWRTLIWYDTWASPALGADGTIYVAGEDAAHGYAYCVHAVSPQGSILWSFDAGNTIYSSPAIGVDGTIYFGSTDNKIYAVNPNTHQAKPGWPVTTGGWVISSPAIARDGTVYVGSYDGKLYALKPDGTYKWPPLTLGNGSSIESSPAMGPDGTVYVGSQDNKVYSINPNTGQVNAGWPYATGFTVRSSPAVATDGTIFVDSDDGNLYALNPNGTPVGAPWPFYGGGGFSSPAIGANGTIYVGSGSGKLYALSYASGPARSTWPMFRNNPWHTGNPSTLTLSSGSLQPGVSFQFQVKGLGGMSFTVEGSESLESWSLLGTVALPAGGTAAFTDGQASLYSYRFYRVRCDSILSYNSLGYMVFNVPTGNSMIANQLDNPLGNTVSVLLPSPPTGTTLYKWNETTQNYDIDTFFLPQGGSTPMWTDPNMTLNPGEGVLIVPGSATSITFIGNLRQGLLANPFPSGFSIRSSMVPQTGPIDTSLWFAPISGDTIYRYDNATGAYDSYTYSGGAWSPSVPTPGVGESVWIDTTTARTWGRNFTVW
jgi:outer membrane protein assembly factor BamB